MKHTKVSGPTRSRSTSVVSSKSGTTRTSKTNENASTGPLRNAARTSRTSKSSASALGVSSHSSNAQTGSSREAPVKQETNIGSIAEEGMMVDDAAAVMRDVKPSRALEANGSGLTPSLGEMGVEVSSAIDVAEHQEIGYDSEDDIGLRGEDADDVDDEEAIMVDDEDDWLALTEEQQIEVENTLTHVRETFDDEVDMYDTTMVAEYADDIFFYMSDLEVSSFATHPVVLRTDVDHSPRNEPCQTRITWSIRTKSSGESSSVPDDDVALIVVTIREMRTTLIDWLLQVHLRYHMLPETLWIAVNIVDRFLSLRVVSLIKLQLVGVTAMFVAAKYEEILAPRYVEPGTAHGMNRLCL